MADCKKYREMISSFADGELSGNDKNELIRHLDECVSCRSLLSLYTNITRAAAESLVEPPENFTRNVMNKIKTLSENELIQISTAKKPKKSLRPVIISFMAAAACLTLAFVVSPQLFGLGKSTNMASIPMASAPINYSVASEEVALDYDMQDAGLKTAGSPDASIAADNGVPDTTDSKLGTAAASAASQPEAGQTPNFTMSGSADSEMLKEYYAVFEIKGQLPAILEGFTMTEDKDGTFGIEITAEIADQLKKEGLTVEMGEPGALKALVRYTP